MRWKVIGGLAGCYEVSDRGHVRSTAKNYKAGKRMLVGGITRQGYLQYCLQWYGTNIYRKAHTLVLEAFVRPRPRGKQANHKDGNKLNNRVDNLEWVTCQQNQQHAVVHQLRRVGVQHHNAKLTPTAVRHLRIAYAANLPIPPIAKRYGVSSVAAYRAAKYKAWLSA